MPNFEITNHYNGEIQIKFFPASHRYQLVGEKTYLIGVTTATGMMDKSGPLLIWASRLTRDYLNDVLMNGEPITAGKIEEAVNLHKVKKEQAATTGTLVHAWVEDYIAGENPPIPEDEQVSNGVLAFLKWVRENDVKFLASEQKVYSKKYKYVGTMDCIFTMHGKNDVIHPGDFKTSSGVYGEMLMQVSAYQNAHTEEFGTKFDDMYILRFDKETGEFEAKCYPKEEHALRFDGFLACLKLKEFSKFYESKYGYYANK